MTTSTRIAIRAARWILLAITLASGAAGAAEPAAWPDHPVTFIQPYGPGTATDAVGRYIADELHKAWNQPTIVEYRPGANGVIGTDAVAHAAPDGYTLMITSTGYFTNEAMLLKLPYDPLKSFVPVAKVGAIELLLCVPADSRFKSVKELVDFARANPGKLTYASGGNGSSQHLAGAMVSTLTGVQVVHVPYKTQVPAMVATATGEVDFSFVAITTARPQIEAGRLRVLASSGAKRSTWYPQVPTMAEAGVPGYDYAANVFFLAPAGTSDTVVRKISDGIAAAARTPGFLRLADSIGIESSFIGHDEWTRTIGADRERWLRIVRDSGAKPE